jgi:hypothetical protein
MTKQLRDSLLYLVVVGFFAVIGCLLFFPVPPGNKDFLQMLLMPLSGAFGYLLGYKPQAEQPK